MLTLEMIQQYLKPVFDKYPISHVYLFGSYAKNEATEKSDIDLAVAIDSSDDPLLVLDIYADCQEILPKQFDIFELSAFKTQEYLKGAKVIYDRRSQTNSESPRPL